MCNAAQLPTALMLSSVPFLDAHESDNIVCSQALLGVPCSLRALADIGPESQVLSGGSIFIWMLVLCLLVYVTWKFVRFIRKNKIWVTSFRTRYWLRYFVFHGERMHINATIQSMPGRVVSMCIVGSHITIEHQKCRIMQLQGYFLWKK
jgi:hypothetical protein